MIFRPLAPLHNITYSVFIISNHRRGFLANSGQTETKPRVQILSQNHWLIPQKNSKNTVRRRKPHLSHMFTKLAPVVEKVDSNIRRIDSFSCLRKKLSDVLYEHQFIIILRKRVVGQQLPTLLDVIHVACVCTPCCIFLCVVGVLEQILKPIKLLATCNGRNNYQEYWELLTQYPIYDDPLSNRRGTALPRYSSSVNRSSIRHGLSAGANTILYGVG